MLIAVVRLSYGYCICTILLSCPLSVYYQAFYLIPPPHLDPSHVSKPLHPIDPTRAYLTWYALSPAA